jgi:hypothetical protein
MGRSFSVLDLCNLFAEMNGRIEALENSLAGEPALEVPWPGDGKVEK